MSDLYEDESCFGPSSRLVAASPRRPMRLDW